MKKTRIFLTAFLLMTVFTFTGCGNQNDVNNDAIPDDQQNNTIQQDLDDGADDVKDDADDLKDDIEDTVDNDDKDDNDGNDGNDDRKKETGTHSGATGQ